MTTLPFSVAPSSTVSRATFTSPLSLPEPPRVRRFLAVTLPLTWPRTFTFEPSIDAWMAAVESTVTSPLALSSPSTLPWILRSPWMLRVPCRLSRGPRLTTLVPPFGVEAVGWVADFSAWAMREILHWVDRAFHTLSQTLSAARTCAPQKSGGARDLSGLHGNRVSPDADAD